MDLLASLLPKCGLVMSMKGTGEITGTHKMENIGNICRFSHNGALVAYVGVDTPTYQSGTFESKNHHISKRGSPHLRKFLFEIAAMVLMKQNPSNPVFCSWKGRELKENITASVPLLVLQSYCVYTTQR